MNLDEDLIWLFLIAVAVFLVAIAILIYAAALLLRVQAKIRQFESPETQRNGDWMERKRQERI